MLPVAAAIAKRALTVSLHTGELRRYSRHLLLPEVGLEGQKKLSVARVLIVGMGGLGAPVSLYLAAAGVGTLGLADFDQVDASNLQRQILYGEADIGADKLTAAAARLRALNAATQLQLHPQPVTAQNAAALVSGYDLVVDGTDNFATRYLLSDTCVAAQKPYIYGSILRFAGQAAVFYPPHGPCYRCLFPKPPPPGQVPSCAEGGVLGVLPGQIGTIQATEALKLLLGIGDPLLGRLLTLDALSMRFSEYRLPRDPTCPACGERPDPVALAKSHLRCQEAPMPNESLEITTEAYHRLRQAGELHTLVDVRGRDEAALDHIAGSVLIPLPELAQRMATLPRDQLLVVHCKSGARSLRAVELLRSQGFTQARSLTGGFDAWSAAVGPSLAYT